MNKLKFEGVPCNHRVIGFVLGFILMIGAVLVLLDGLANFFVQIGFASSNYFSGFLIWILVILVVFIGLVALIDVVSMFNGDWSKWQRPLLNIRRSLHGFSNSVPKDDSLVNSKTELNQFNRAVNRTYFSVQNDIYKLVIPLPKGAIDISNSLVNALDATQSAQAIISADLKPSGFRINLRQKHFGSNSLYWILRK